MAKIRLTEAQFKEYCRKLLNEKRSKDYAKEVINEALKDVKKQIPPNRRDFLLSHRTFHNRSSC